MEGPFEFGLKPCRKNVLGDTKARNEKILEIGVEECVAQGLIHIKDYLKLKQNVDAYNLNAGVRPPTLDRCRGHWYYGPPGTGKSTAARNKFPGAFLKASSKWWDGYKGEKAVILDDLDTHVLGHLVKIWTDRFPITNAEIKQSTIVLFHEDFVITSNYTPEELWKDDPMMAAAIRRRCQFHHFSDPLGAITGR